MSANKNKLRKSRAEIKKEFEQYKKDNKLNGERLKNLISHCEVNKDIIESYLDNLRKEDNDLFLNELFLFYPILPIEVCKKYNVKKNESEKERFFKLIKNLSNIKEQNVDIELNLIRYLKNEILNCDEIKHLIPKTEYNDEIKLREKKKNKRIELKKKKAKNNELSKIEIEKEDLAPFKYSRWNIVYNTVIDYKTEDNEEFLFYHLSNCLISEFLKNQDCFIKRIDLIIFISNLIENAYLKREIFAKNFEFLCMALTNSEINIKDESELERIINAIEQEINNKFMNINEIKNYLNKINCNCEYINNKIIINYEKKKIIIDDYNYYCLNEDIINALLKQNITTYKKFLQNFRNYNAYFDKLKKDNDLLIKVIKKFSRSNLAFSSIQRLFNIEQSEYEDLFKELSDNIESYIYFLPLNCYFNTERTSKNPIKIIIDPFKEKYNLDINYINNNDKLHTALSEFCNIAIRKFFFEHEIQHLITALLYFLYINENSNLNSITKELDANGNIICHPGFNPEDISENKNKNIQKEAGSIFEVLCYGDIQKKFTLKQLLFIANENNDNLDCDSFKIKYDEECKKNVSELLKEFPENQLLSGYVKIIKECIENNPKNTVITNILNTNFIAHKDEKEEDYKDIYSILNDNNTILATEFERYNNQYPFAKRPRHESNKKK